jgi:hypothetical protein
MAAFAMKHFGMRWPVNGETYVHWYDCISDYIR